MSASIKITEQKHKHLKAVTMLEVLMVLVTILFISSILFPVTIRSKESAKKATCLEELRQISLATLMYSIDYDDNYPFYVVNNPADGGPSKFPREVFYWYDGFFDPSPVLGDETPHPEWSLLYPYKKNPDILSCPSFERKTYILNYLQVPLAYAVNNLVMPRGFLNEEGTGYLVPNKPTNGSQIERSAETVLMADVAIAFPTKLEITPIIWPVMTEDLPYFHGRHNGHCNVAWADGHAKSLAPTIRPDAYWPVSEFTVPLFSDPAKANHIGDLLHPDYPYSLGEPDVSYYLNLKKPH